ncbi:hypothetical protein M409DRAFT_24455 [Zasmidium cellare ATCC 36951]|uniref:Uncharacterized protein n=1 Tax=Zasmidium cellare ATCC 36951 TaxID=1080233 RepID=A0A6A6CHA6_ZASCE|nr:uncharacterized protein M409DRAFT_24455 [Zasmidium cellare ATCC 36951]KAF2165069.1 hypothetical protein M409DRAFT_24455 [Zasmidium cellare ATCC 36951]
MSKAKSKNQKQRVGKSLDDTITKPRRTVADLREDWLLWYKICVLVYDLHNMAKDKTCERRLLQTTDELYISAPYFTDEEAVAIKAAHVDSSGTSLEDALTTNLQTFFDKRRASGDCRPCGPHDMVPVYLSSFGMEKMEVEDEKSVARVRRSGLRAG